MCRILAAPLLIFLISVTIRPTECRSTATVIMVPPDRPLDRPAQVPWSHHREFFSTASLINPLEQEDHKNRNEDSQRVPDVDYEDEDTNMVQMESYVENLIEESAPPVVTVMEPQEKRALAMLARWGPFSDIGKQRTPIRSSYLDPNINLNTQTRGRIVGQPLRWG